MFSKYWDSCSEAQRFFHSTFLHATSLMYITNGLPLCNYNYVSWIALISYGQVSMKTRESQNKDHSYEALRHHRGFG